MRLQADPDQLANLPQRNTWEERWAGPDAGIYAAWERGLEMASEDPESAARAKAGELLVLPWKGGIEGTPKAKVKTGSHLYLAMWLGLRRDSLDIDLTTDTTRVCSRCGVTVTYTSDILRIARAK